jgi:hypothetical protein
MGQHAGSREGMKPNLAANHSSQRSLTPMFAVVREGERELAVIGVLLAYVAVWTLYGVLSKGSQDVHFDMAESGAAGYVALPVLLVLVAVGLHRDVLGDILWPPERPRRFMAAAFWTPLFLPALVAPLLGSKITSLWTMSAWTLLPVVLLSSPLVSLSHRAVVAIIAVAVAVPLLMTAAAPAIAIYVHRVDAVTPAAAQSRLLAERVAQEWSKVTDQPLRLIGGNGELVYGLAFYSPGRPSAFPDFDLSTAPWVNPARIILQGIAIVCYASDPTCLATAEALGLTGRRIEVRIAREHSGEIGQAGDYVIMIVPPRP